jgi:hypothetical protein
MGVVEGKDKNGEPIIGEQFLCRDPEERVFYKGRWYEGLYLHAGESEDDKQQLQKFNAEVDQWIAWRDAKGRRAFTLPVSACSDDAEVTALDRLSMSEWMDSVVHECAAALVGRLRLPRRLRHDSSNRRAPGPAFLFLFACRRRRNRVAVADHVAGRQRASGPTSV